MGKKTRKSKKKSPSLLIDTGIWGYERLERILRMTQAELKAYLKRYLEALGYEVVDEDGFLFGKGNVDILLLAHMDTVHKEIPEVIYTSPDGIVSSPQGIGGDDRCGVYAITEVIKEIKCSVLFCEDEEIGGLGALKFTQSDHLAEIEKMRYMVELDRKGKSDLVFYDCDNPEFEEFLFGGMPGFKKAYGSFSDISVLMGASGVAGVNVSAGYFNEHYLNETIDLEALADVTVAIKKLVRMESPKFEFIDGTDWDYWDEYYYPYGLYGDSWQCKEKEKIETRQVVLYVSFEEGGVTKEECFVGATVKEAFYEFFYEHSDKCMNDILDFNYKREKIAG